MTIDQGALQSDHRDESEFQNSYFIRGRPELLVHLKRRAAANSASAQNVQITAVRQAATLDQAEMDDKVTTLESKLHRLQATQVINVITSLLLLLLVLVGYDDDILFLIVGIDIYC